MSSVERARQQYKQARERLNAALARENAEKRKLDTRRKIILGSLLLEAASTDEQFSQVVDTLRGRIKREQDLKPFAEWKTPKPEQT